MDDLGREEPRLAAQVVGPRVVHGRPVISLEHVGAAQGDVAAARALVRVVQARARRRPFDLGRDALLARRRGLRFACAEHELLAKAAPRRMRFFASRRANGSVRGLQVDTVRISAVRNVP